MIQNTNLNLNNRTTNTNNFNATTNVNSNNNNNNNNFNLKIFMNANKIRCKSASTKRRMQNFKNIPSSDFRLFTETSTTESLNLVGKKSIIYK